MRSCRRTSFTINDAARETALIVKAENKNGNAPPTSSPIKTLGNATLMPLSRRGSSVTFSGMLSTWCWARSTSAKNDPNSATAAITAEPIATPLVTALVVLPVASRSSITSRALFSRFAISPMPLALSEIGPNASIEMVLPVRLNMPMPVSDTPYKTAIRSPPRKISTEAKIDTPITSAAYTLDS